MARKLCHSSGKCRSPTVLLILPTPIVKSHPLEDTEKIHSFLLGCPQDGWWLGSQCLANQIQLGKFVHIARNLDSVEEYIDRASLQKDAAAIWEQLRYVVTIILHDLGRQGT